MLYIYIYAIYIYTSSLLSLPPSGASLPPPYPTPLGDHRTPGWAPCDIY